MTLKASLEAIRHDADVWDRISSVTNVASHDAHGLVLTENDLSWAGNHTSLLGTYTQIQQKTAVLLGEATRVFSGLSTALDQVADAYQADDEDAAARFKGLWDARE